MYRRITIGMVWSVALVGACALDPVTVGRVLGDEHHGDATSAMPPDDDDDDHDDTTSPGGDDDDAAGDDDDAGGDDDDAGDDDDVGDDDDDATGDDDDVDDDDDDDDDATATGDDADVDGTYHGNLRMRVRNLTAGLSDFCERDDVVATVQGGVVQPTAKLTCTYDNAPWTDTFASWWADGPPDAASGEVSGEMRVDGPTWSVTDAWTGYFGQGQLSGDFLGHFDNDGYSYELEGRFFLER